MELQDKYYTDERIIKKLDDKIFYSEYTLGTNKFINISVNQSASDMGSVYEKIINQLIKNDYKILSQFFFGNEIKEKENKKLGEKYFTRVSWPVTTLWQKGESWGTLITAISSHTLNTIYQNNIAIGNQYSDEFSDYCELGGLLPDLPNSSKELSTESVFNMIESVLNSTNMDFNNIVRTWFYLDDLLSWYNEFNVVRTNYFNKKNVFNNLIPASTGIGAKNNFGKHLVAAGFAIKPKYDKVQIFAVPSPLQCPAVDYKSSFSRAVEIDHPYYNKLIISGTASINADGLTANIGNVYNQIDLTMNVVKSILESRDMNWTNVTKGIVYFKDINNINLYYEYCNKNNIPDMPLVIIEADICRDELLFEIELDAVKIKGNN